MERFDSDFQEAMRPNQTEIENRESVESLNNQFDKLQPQETSDSSVDDLLEKNDPSAIKEPGAEMTHDEFFEAQEKFEAEILGESKSDAEFSSTELLSRNSPDNISEIESMEYMDSHNIVPSRNLEDPNFYDGKSSPEEYAAMAEKIPEVRDRLEGGDSIESLCEDEELKDCANAYFNENRQPPERGMLTVRENEDGSYQLCDDGNHRLKAAQDLGYDVPVRFR